MIAMLVLPAFHARSDEEKLPFYCINCDVRDLLYSYSKMTNRKVWVTLDLRADITIRTEGPITKAEAGRIIRTTLLERYGIELRDSGDKEAFASWSDNPKYKEVRDAADKMRIGRPDVRTESKGRVKILEPGEPQK